MTVVSRRRAGLRRMRLAGAVLALSLCAIAGALPAHAQAIDQTTAGTQAIPAPTPSIFPTPTPSSQTCLFGCTSQSQACQNTCVVTSGGTTVIPSITIVGTTTSPLACTANCSTQLTACQRNCNLGP